MHDSVNYIHICLEINFTHFDNNDNCTQSRHIRNIRAKLVTLITNFEGTLFVNICFHF